MQLKRLKLRKNNWNSESYRFDEVFTESASQKRVYEVVAKPVVEVVEKPYAIIYTLINLPSFTLFIYLLYMYLNMKARGSENSTFLIYDIFYSILIFLCRVCLTGIMAQLWLTDKRAPERLTLSRGWVKRTHLSVE